MRSIAITSGKGGVGKTNISANLSVALARHRQRVVVFDADIGLANLDVVLGCKVESTLQNVLSGDKTLSQVLHPGPGGIRFVPGGSGIEALFNLNDHQKERFFDELATLEKDTDILIFDTGAGLDSNVMTFLQAADEVLVVVTPDPASLTDGYATAKALFKENPTADVGLILNMVESQHEAKQVYAHLFSVVQRFLGAHLKYAGCVRMDMGAVTFIRRRVPFIVGDPNLPASVDINRLAAAVLGKATPEGEAGGLITRLRSLFGRDRKIA